MVESIREALNVGKSILKNNNMDEREARLLLFLQMNLLNLTNVMINSIQGI